MKLQVTFEAHKFIALVGGDWTVEEAVGSLNRLVKDLFPGERREIVSLTWDGYTLPGRYVLGEVLDTGAKVDAESTEPVRKLSPTVPRTEPIKKPKKRNRDTPGASREAEQISDDSDSAPDQKHSAKPIRVNLFRS